MVNFPGRSGRRRRVLNEEVLSGANARQVVADRDATQAPRYSDAAGVENHPQITDFVPRKYRSVVLLLVTGVTTAVTLGALHYFSDALAKFVGAADSRPFNFSAPSSIADWITSVILMVASAFCLMVYSIRRHKIDDIRGRYRVWLAASLACIVLSLNTITGLHTVLASSLTHFTGWTALRSGAAWWLLIAGLPIAWITLRALIDVKECRLAGTLMLVAIACQATAAASYFGWMPSVEPEHQAMVTGVAKFLGYWTTFAAVVSYARFVVLDAQGLVTIRRTATKTPAAAKPKQSCETKTTVEKPTVLSVAGYTRPKLAETPATADKWVDGSRFERESYDDDADDDDEDSGTRKLSKADRKRLRKLKTQNRAA